MSLLLLQICFCRPQDALALVAWRICTSYGDPSALQPFIACCLIALDKCPGVTYRYWRSSLEDHWQSNHLHHQGRHTGSCRCCTIMCRSGSRVWSNRACYEASVWIPYAAAVILIDATNAFNTLNRENALSNIQHLCPPIAKVLIITCQRVLYIDGETLLSQEGTPQGDPLAMVMYGIAVIPLICRVAN